MNSNEFSYLTFVNNNHQYLELLKSTVESIISFSKFQLIIYFIDCPVSVSNQFLHPKTIIRHLNNINLPCIYYYKPYVIIDAIKNGLQSGYYIESDDVITPYADSLFDKAKLLTNIPISPVHPDSPSIPSIDFEVCDVDSATQHYIHGHVLFNSSNLDFMKEWMENCLRYNNFRNADETVLNMMYWKYNCQNHYLPIIDPWYENFYLDEATRKTACTFHGCKDPLIQSKLLHDMKQFYM